jgi:catechol 2,3-dioxygenase-like lactoylglutathione lyase family enzyme
MPPPKLTHVRLLCDDVMACLRFYRDVLGFAPRYGDVESVYHELESGAVTIALFNRKLMADAVHTSGLPAVRERQDDALLTFEVESVDDAHARLKAKGATFVTDPHDQPAWQIRVAHFRDPAGHLLEIYGPLKTVSA